jgi:hypothetical protein
LLAWDRIESWQWKTGDGQSLVLTLKKGPGVLWGRVKESLFVPADQQAAVERAFAERLPVSKIAPASETDKGGS